MFSLKDQTATDLAVKAAHTDKQMEEHASKFRKALADKVAGLALLFADESDEYVQKGIVRALCYHADRQITWYRTKLEEQGQRLRRAAMHNDGSEVSNERLENTIAYTRRLETAMELSADLLQAAESVYSNLFGEPWKNGGPVDPGVALSRCTTDSQREALAISMRYSKPQKHLARGTKSDRTVDDRTYYDTRND